MNVKKRKGDFKNKKEEERSLQKQKRRGKITPVITRKRKGNFRNS